MKGEQPTQPIALETAHLSRAVVGKVLTDDINVQIQIGEVVAVVGPSGSGKSSFVRLLNRLDESTGGTVRLNGEDYPKLAPQELRRGQRHDDDSRSGAVARSTLLADLSRHIDSAIETKADVTLHVKADVIGRP